MTIIGLYNFKLSDLPGSPKIDIYLYSTGEYLGTIAKTPFEMGWLIVSGGELEGRVFLDEEKAADALKQTWEKVTAENIRLGEMEG